MLQMYLLAKFGDLRSYRNRDINSYTSSYMDSLGKPELNDPPSAIFLTSGITICNPKSRTAGRTPRKRRRKKRTQALAKRYAFHANAKYEFIPTPFFLQYYICD